ncbi:dnaJ subfamily B member 1-like [Histomonas meleagridis]|uniref:dnaJ-like subfamily B member 1-like n=1 Tax=Histomonas meleagridis TaxID=135588 RepID=UPI003559C575|nr:dnaJ subfamily B member 1-like [Histomonas meleagridis]KAH0805117.1 dnaJ-like subfamily B member 1-like [Histomonas meleagridis]
MNPYNLLKITPNATREEINNAYRKFAIKYHPDRNKSDEAPRLFAEYSEAFEILNDLKLRAAYDQFGRKGLEDLRWKPTDPETVFFNFFGSSNPYDYLLPSRNATEFARLTKPNPPIPNEPLLIELSAPLSDFVYGHTRMASGVRRLPDGQTEEVQLACEIHPGMIEGTQIIFPNLGHADQKDSKPADAIVTISMQPHLLYSRYGNDLVFTQNITLVEALIGKKFKVPLMDGRVLPLHLTDIAAPGYKICVNGEGVPIWDDVHNEIVGKGNLYIEFNVEWPINRSDEIWKQLTTAFSEKQN